LNINQKAIDSKEDSPMKLTRAERKERANKKVEAYSKAIHETIFFGILRQKDINDGKIKATKKNPAMAQKIPVQKRAA
jgi:DNA replication protein DnaD